MTNRDVAFLHFHVLSAELSCHFVHCIHHVSLNECILCIFKISHDDRESALNDF